MEKIHTKKISEKISMKKLFSLLNIPNEEHAIMYPPFDIKIKTPYGYKKITSLFRTENQSYCELYFSNGRTLQCSINHMLKINGEWGKVSDIFASKDIIEAEEGITTLKSKKNKGKKILYDISVEDVHCYYSNSILSHNSWSLISIGMHALSLGKTLVHFTLELNDKYVSKRYDSRLTGIASQNLKFHVDEIIRKHESIVKGQLMLKYYPTKTASVTTLKSHLDKLISFGIKPNLILIDYADLLRSENIHNQKAGSYFEVGSIYEDLRGMAGEYAVPVWTVSQVQRSAANEDIITGEYIAESYKKIMTADFVVSVSRKIEDKLANTARWHVIKNRYGPDGLTFPSKMDASIGKIEIYNATSVSGTETRKEMRNSNELVRKELANRYADFE